MGTTVLALLIRASHMHLLPQGKMCVALGRQELYVQRSTHPFCGSDCTLPIRGLGAVIGSFQPLGHGRVVLAHLPTFETGSQIVFFDSPNRDTSHEAANQSLIRDLFLTCGSSLRRSVLPGQPQPSSIGARVPRAVGTGHEYHGQ